MSNAETQKSKELAAYHRLHDFLSDMIEGGRLTESDIPDDYQAVVEALVVCGGMRNQAAMDAGNIQPCEKVISPVCKNCGSKSIQANGQVAWDHEAQEWTKTLFTYDDFYCPDCETESKSVEWITEAEKPA